MLGIGIYIHFFPHCIGTNPVFAITPEIIFGIIISVSVINVIFTGLRDDKHSFNTRKMYNQN